MTDNRVPGREENGGARHIDEETCLDLLQGLLPPVERERVLAHLSECPSCENLFRARAAEAERVDATMAVHSLPDGRIVLERRGTAVRGTRAKRAPGWDVARRWWHYLGILASKPRHQLAGAVAVALIIVARVLLPLYMGPSRAPDLHPLPLYVFTLESRGAAEGVRQDLEAGLDAYRAGDFRSAIGLLSKPSLSGIEEPDVTVRTIFLGSALAWNGDYDEAAEVLMTASLDAVPGKWGEEAGWTLYVSLRESGHKGAADSLLRVLAQRPGEVGGRAAEALGIQDRAR